MNKNIMIQPQMTIGLDLGDRISHGCIFDEPGKMVRRFKVATHRQALGACFSDLPICRVVIEVGTHSRWVCRLLEEFGHEVIVANPWRVKLIHQDNNKNDKRDAEFLARLGRADPQLLAPIKHRGERAARHRVMLKSRGSLVEARTKMINHARGVVKSFGERLPAASAESFVKKVIEHIPQALCEALTPILDTITDLTLRIYDYERRLERLATEEYPETERLRQIAGVGLLTSLAFVLTIDDPGRFEKSRGVGPYIGLVPKQSSSGKSNPQLSITRAGDGYLRKLLVQAAHYVLGPFGPDCDLRRYGERIFERGGANTKKRAVIAVARKLAILMHRLWTDGADYDPFYNLKRAEKKASKTLAKDSGFRFASVG